MPRQREFRLDPATEGILAAREDDRRRRQRTTSKKTGKSTPHYHFNNATSTLVRDNHPGGHLRHQHLSRGLVGYGRTRASFTPL